MFGRQPGKIVELREVDIHGARFYDVAYALNDSPQRVHVSRVGVESVYENPQTGDAVSLHLVMGQLTKVEKHEN